MLMKMKMLVLSAALALAACTHPADVSRPLTEVEDKNAHFTVEDILGSTRTATASTNVLILGTGNNVEPERDMRRRVVSIYLAPPGESPALLKYGDDPVGHVRRDRGRAVCAALTIIEAHKAAGQPLADVTDIGTFGTWTALCRQPLMWLGEPDPATSGCGRSLAGGEAGRGPGARDRVEN